MAHNICPTQPDFLKYGTNPTDGHTHFKRELQNVSLSLVIGHKKHNQGIFCYPIQTLPIHPIGYHGPTNMGAMVKC